MKIVWLNDNYFVLLKERVDIDLESESRELIDMKKQWLKNIFETASVYTLQSSL